MLIYMPQSMKIQAPVRVMIPFLMTVSGNISAFTCLQHCCWNLCYSGIWCCGLETVGTDYPAMQHHVPEE